MPGETAAGRAAGRNAIREFGGQPALADRTLQYIVASRPLHERLRQILTQVAGFSLLVMAQRRSPPLLDGPLAVARSALPPAREAIAALPVPPQARHHHHHLAGACTDLAGAFDLLSLCLRHAGDDAARALLVGRLRAAAEHLRAATRALPGFAMADLGQACCAAHGGQRALECR